MTGSTRLIPIAPQAGLYKNTTALDASNRYIDGDKVRFRYGKPEKIGGWQEETTSESFEGISRDILPWKTRTSRKFLALGGTCKLQLFDVGDVHDLTPIKKTLTGSLNYTSTISTVLVSVNIVGHDMAVGDYIIFPTAVTGNGITLDGEMTITSVTDTNNLVLTSSTTATSSGTFADATSITVLLECGAADNGTALGWGAGTWDTAGETPTSGWGDPRNIGIPINLRQWSLDTYGEDLLACVREGGIYFWDFTTGTGARAVTLTNSPEFNNLMLVHGASRHVIAFGSTDLSSGLQDPLLIRWGDKDDFTDWTPATGNSSGSLVIESGSEIVAAVETKREIVVFTNSSVHTIQYIGGDFQFSLQTLSDTGNIAGQHAGVDANGVVYWMGDSSFYVYDGSVRAMPCSLQEHIFDPSSAGSMNLSQKEKVYGSVNEEFNEVIWFYPSRDSLEIDRYVIYNYLEDTWYDGTMVRTVWADKSVFDRPYAVDTSGQLWIQEQGKNDGASPMLSFIQTNDIQLSEGDEFLFIDRIIPDADIVNQITYTIETKKFPNALASTIKGPYPAVPTTEKISLRARGRSVNLRIETNITNGDYRIGRTRIGVFNDGRR